MNRQLSLEKWPLDCFAITLKKRGGKVHLKIRINSIKLLGMFWELSSNVFRANKNGLQVRPRSLDLEPDDNHRVSY